MTDVRELIDAELDAVCGGTDPFASIFQAYQSNSATQLGLAFAGNGGNGGNATGGNGGVNGGNATGGNGGNGGNATVTNLLNQQNFI
jgi:hypothetical protein